MDFTEGIKALVLGLPTVFIVLMMISGVISLFGLFNFDKKTEVVKQAPKTVITKPEEDDLALIAMITAAVAASMNTTTDQLEIISFREINKVTRGSWTIRQ